RMLVYEECLGGTTPLHLGTGFALGLRRRLGPLLDGFAAHAADVHRQLQRHGAGLLSALGGGASVPFLAAVAGLAAAGPFVPDPPAVERAATGLFAGLGGGAPLANVLPGSRVKIVPFEFPGPTIEITAASERPPGPGRVPAAQVWASVEDGQPVLRGPDGGPL